MFMWYCKDFLIFYATGGSAPSFIVRPPATAKNIITVGATYNGVNANQMFISAGGPTQDNRYKPTVTAPGAPVYSSVGPGNDYYAMSGTSNASPCAAGNGALIRNYFAKGFYPTGDSTPANAWTYISAALVKACIINGAHPEIIGSTIPDNRTGWGRVHLDDVLYFYGDIRRLAVVDDTHGVATGEFQEYIVTVNNQSEPLKITLVWTDYYAAAGANPAIINDLDLYVIGPNGAYYAGNRYSNGQSIPNDTTWDNRNVEECVRCNVPEIGDWVIRIRGRNVPQGPQPFALVVSGGLGTITIPTLHICGSMMEDPYAEIIYPRVGPGMALYLTDTLKNLSAVDVTNCMGTLRTTSSYATIFDSVGNFGDILVGGTGNNGACRFRFKISPATPIGTYTFFTLHLTGDGGYSQDIPFDLGVGFGSNAVIIWGPKQVQIPMGDTSFLYGLGYNPQNDRIYVTNIYERSIYIYAADSNVGYLGNISAPDTCCSDIKYCVYDNTFWVAADFWQSWPNGKRVCKINTAGTVLRQFPNPANDYPTGLAWLEPQRLLYLADRRAALGALPHNIYCSDTLGNATQMAIPLQGNYGPRCLAREPLASLSDTTLLLVYTWFNSMGNRLDSSCIFELRRSDLAVLSRITLPGWNVRGIEHDPRDGNYWLTIPQNPGHSIVKIKGFYEPLIGVVDNQRVNLTTEFALISSLPNPCNNRLKISYSIPKRMRVKLNLYDVTGRLVMTFVNRIEEPGVKIIEWDGKTADGSTIANGVYFYYLETEHGSLVRKLVHTR